MGLQIQLKRGMRVQIGQDVVISLVIRRDGTIRKNKINIEAPKETHIDRTYDENNGNTLPKEGDEE